MKLNALCFFRQKRRKITKKNHRPYRQVLLTMKLTALFFLAACLQVSAKGHSQTVTLALKNAPLQKVFKEINRQTGFQFFYKDDLLKQAGKVDIDVKNVTVDEALKLCFASLPITYAIVDNTIVLKEKPAFSGATVDEIPPPLDVTGIVKDEKDVPVAGASIIIKGTNKGTTTDANGFFQLKNLNNNDVLVITGTNIETIEVNVAGRTLLNITAKIKVSEVDEIQIVGYGTTTKRMNTGTVATIKGDDIKDRPVTNVMQALQGKLSGVAIINNNSGVGAANSILIRGINSITSGTNPLIIVDGVVVNERTDGLVYYNNYTGSNVPYSNSVFNFINPSDIESVDVLKDADATAIYGSRGTNGVILITTRKASLGKTKVTANISTGWKSPTVITKRMNTEQYLQMRKDAFATGNMTSPTAVINPITPTALNAPDLLVWDQNAYTDYAAMELKNPAPNYHADMNLSGGTKAWNFLTSGSYDKMYDVYMNKPYQELATGRLQINHTSPDNRLNLRLGSTFGTTNQKFSFMSAVSKATPATINNPPNFPLYKTDGSYNLGAYNGNFYLGYNPLPGMAVSNTSKTNNVLLNGELSYSIVRGLVAKLQTSFNSQSNASHLLYPSTVINSQDPFTTSPYGNHSTNRFTSVNLEPQLTYNWAISKATFTALAGATFLDKKRQATSIKVNNPGSDALLNSYASGQPTTGYSDNSEEKFTSVFGRLTADWDKKYLLDLNFRRDGSSRFGPNNRFANFAAAGLGWIFTSEPFLKNNLSFLSYGKLRASYGTTGNNNIPDYQYLSLLQTPGGISPGGTFTGQLYPANYPNPDIKWENTTKTDVGMELGFLKNRILLTATWYRSVTSNLLVNLPLGGQGGFISYYGNFPGKVQNTGLEFELVTQNLSIGSQVKWTTKFNLSYNTNILKSFPNLAATSYSNMFQVGRALPNNFSSLGDGFAMEMPYIFTGIDPATGLPQFKDVNKDGVVNANDEFSNASWIGTSLPTTWGGLTNSVSYKGFSLDVFVQFSTGIFPKWNFGLNSPIGSLFNPSADLAGNYWMKPGDIKKYPRLYTGTAGTAAYINPIWYYYPFSSANLYKGYYVRLKNVQLSYSLPATLLSKIKMAAATVYINAENPAVYTPVKLYTDPEISWSNHSNVMLRTITMGIRLEF